MKDNVIPWLSKYPHQFFAVSKWTVDSGEAWPSEPDREAASPAEASIIASRIPGDENEHTVMLDLDVPARLIPSTTPGHYHLYIDVKVSWSRYQRLLHALERAGILQPGYVKASIARGYSALRLPWVRKEV
jgi:hypothetical protein